MPDQTRTESPNPFTHLRNVAVVVGVYLLALIAWLVAGGRWPGGRWFGVHLFTLGVVTNLILALSDHFARTLTHHGGRASRWQLPVVNAGIAAVLWGIPNRHTWVIAAGATILVAEVMRSYAVIRRLRRRSLGGRFAWIVRSYERAHGAFVHGAILGALIGSGIVTGSWTFSARIAHLHVNVLGWAGLTLLATLVFFGPTMVRTRIEPGADARAATVLPWGATALTVAVLAMFGTGVGGAWAVALRLLAAIGLLVYGWGVVEVGVPLIRAARRARPSANRAALVMVPAWFSVVVGADALVVATGQWRYLDALGVTMLSGVLFQAIAASLAYLAPLFLRSHAAARARLSTRIDRYATARTIAWNVGVTCTALAAAFGSSIGTAGSVAIRLGWGLILAATLWLGAAILFPSLPSVVAESGGREVGDWAKRRRTGGQMDVRSWLEGYRRAWEERDADAAAALFDERASYRSNIFEAPYEGRDGVRRYWQEVTRTQEDVRVVMGRPFADGERVAAEFWTTMRNDGADITLPGCLLLRFGEDGRCLALREYWHVEPGRLDPPPGWGDLPASPDGPSTSG